MSKKKKTSDYRINLRLPADAHEAIEALRYEGNGKLSYNAWVIEAVQEKIRRDSIREVPPTSYGDGQRTFHEFFAGGGMARLGLGSSWTCLFANDFDPVKARAYRDNWSGGTELVVKDVNELREEDVPGSADLIWASFPCQDLSLAGKYQGLGRGSDDSHTRSGSFWPFWRLVDGLSRSGRGPKIVALENVVGVLTSNDGKDFAAISDTLVKSGYRFGAVVIDAKLFVPQSRPRVFFVAVRKDLFVPSSLTNHGPIGRWHSAALESAFHELSETQQRNWIWWNLPSPPPRTSQFADLIEDDPDSVEWHSPAETRRLLSMMSSHNIKKISQAKQLNTRVVGGVYRRTRTSEDGSKIQRAEVRLDGLAGCLRTPSGGSSRQLIVVIEGSHVRSRLISSREAARLMGLPDSYRLPKSYNEAYYLAGDGVAVPAVEHLSRHLLVPIVDANRAQAILPFKVA